MVSAFDYMDFISKIGVGGVTGVIASIVTAKLTLGRFYSEKWWEKKHIAYNQLVDTLIEMKTFYSIASIHYQKVRITETLLGASDECFDWSRFYELDAQIRRSYILAPISLSCKTKALLITYFDASDQINYAIYNENYPEEVAYSDLVKIIQKLIDVIVEDAKKELRFE